MSTTLTGVVLLAQAAAPHIPSTPPEPEPDTATEIIVVGRAEQPITIAPRGLSVSLGETEFEAINAVNVEDLMKYAPNFFVRKRYIGDANGVPGFRGTHSTQSARSLVMVDGFIVSNLLGNSFSFAPKWGVVGPGEVRQFDIVYGPYSARYPGNSMGGIVSITSRPPEADEAYATVQSFAQPYRQYGTDKTFVGYSAEAGLGFRQADGPWAWRVSYRRLDNVGHPQSFSQLAPVAGPGGRAVIGAVIDPELVDPSPISGAASPDHMIQDQLRARVDYDFGGGWSAQALLVFWSTKSDQTDPETYLRDATGAPVYEGRVSFDGRSWTAGALNLQVGDRRELLGGLRLGGAIAGWNMTVNLSRFIVDRQRSRASSGYAAGVTSGPGTLTEQGDVGWTTLDINAERRLGGHQLAIGLNINGYQTEQTSYSTADWRAASGRAFSAGTSGKTSLVGAYAEDEMKLSPRLSVTAGFRYESWRAFDGAIGRPVAGQPRFQSYPEREEDAFSPKLSVQWEFASDWHAQLSLATATRFPTVGELFQGRLDSLGDFDPNSFDPNLKAERSRDANLILRHRAGPVRVTGSLFYQHVENAIFSLQGLNQFGVVTSSFKNIDVVRQYGAELIAEASDLFVPGLDLDANMAWIDARTVRSRALPASEGVRFPRTPEWRANANLRYRVRHDLRLSLGARYASRPNSDLLGLQRGDTYGYTSELLILDARATLDVTDQVQLSVGIDNLANDHAWVFHPYPQRTALVELRWTR